MAFEHILTQLKAHLTFTHLLFSLTVCVHRFFFCHFSAQTFCNHCACGLSTLFWQPCATHTIFFFLFCILSVTVCLLERGYPIICFTTHHQFQCVVVAYGQFEYLFLPFSLGNLFTIPFAWQRPRQSLSKRLNFFSLSPSLFIYSICVCMCAAV